MRIEPDITSLTTELGIRQKKVRKLFSPGEDKLLIDIMSRQSFSSWQIVASQIQNRSPRQCRDRWVNYLAPKNKNGPWSEDEDRLLASKVKALGPTWTVIAKSFDGRSENNVKNRWYTHIKGKYSLDDISSEASPPPSEPIKPSDGQIKQNNRILLPPISALDEISRTSFLRVLI